MVLQYAETRLDGLSANGETLLLGQKQIARFPTQICELIRFEDRVFVVLHPYPIAEQADYASTNLWALDLDGKFLWKAPNLNATTNSSDLD